MSSLAPEEIAGLGFEEVVRNAPVAISVIAACGRVIYSNARARDLTSRQLGYDMPADLDGAIDIFHPDGRHYEQREWPAVRSITSGEEIAEEEFFYAPPDRPRLFIRCSSSPVRDKHGEIVAAVVTMTDITERKRQEERITYLAELLDTTEDGVVAMDERYFLTVWNKGAERLYGWKAAEVVGRHTNEVAVTSLGEAGRAEMRRELAEDGRWRGEVGVARKDGTTVDVELVSVALRGQHDEITGYLTIHRDISERKRAEEALREAQGQRAAADARLEDVREAERQRIARDLHDGALQSLTTALVVNGRDTRNGAGDVQAILQQVGRQLRAAIYDLSLDHDDDRRFSDALRELVELNRETASSCDVVLETNDDLPTGSSGRRGTEVLRIISEALTNACRHAGAQHIIVRVTGPETRLSVEVTDDGRGFKPDPSPSALHGHGVRGMRERAERLGADFDIRSDQTGTTVWLQVALTLP
jgi:PAS domain S-box-containing protein